MKLCHERLRFVLRCAYASKAVRVRVVRELILRRADVVHARPMFLLHAQQVHRFMCVRVCLSAPGFRFLKNAAARLFASLLFEYARARHFLFVFHHAPIKLRPDNCH